MKAVAYIRVSATSQVDGHSLDAQERLFHEYCKARGWVPFRVYREKGRSARSDSLSKRPVFRQLLSDSASGEFDVIVVHTLDRWARNQGVLLESLSVLARNNVALASITENIDYSTPQGRLFIQMLGGFAQYFSDSLATHVSKGISQRAVSGRHTGGISFGYESCWDNSDGERKRRCEPEHPGGLHPVDAEAKAVRDLFKRYSSGTTTLAELAIWMNEQGFKTRNTKNLPDGDGNLVAGPKQFTRASVRWILHNPFYTGMIKHKDELYQGAHEGLIGKKLFDQVQSTLRKNSGRSNTVKPKPPKDYLLKGIARCSYCKLPLWSQTYKSGTPMYREHRASRSIADCPSAGGSIKCQTIDEQMDLIVRSIELNPNWEEQVMGIISVRDEVERVEEERRKTVEKLRRLGTAFVDGVYEENEYRRRKRELELELESLIVPDADDAQKAGELIENLAKLWEGATLAERHKLLVGMLDGVYIDIKKRKRILAIKPKPAFKAVFAVATTKADSGVVLINDDEDWGNPDAGYPVGPSDQPNNPSCGHSSHDGLSLDENTPCSWWRRGRVELPVQKTPRREYTTSLSGT